MPMPGMSEILSSDYSDLTLNGPTPDDLGTYTSFMYKRVHSNYLWRNPQDTAKANFQDGENTQSMIIVVPYCLEVKKFIMSIKSKLAIIQRNSIQVLVEMDLGSKGYMAGQIQMQNSINWTVLSCLLPTLIIPPA